MQNAWRIAEFLLDVGAVKLSPKDPFQWTSGILSPIYCDNRMMYGHPQARSFIVNALADEVKALRPSVEVVAGTATAAIGWAALVADRLELPFVYVRSKPKEHGLQKRIEGHLPAHKHIVVVEDLLSTGGSAVSTVESLRDEGKGTVTDIVAIFSYTFQAAGEAAEEHQVKLHPLCDITVLLDVAIKQNRIKEDEVKMVQEFVKNPS